MSLRFGGGSDYGPPPKRFFCPGLLVAKRHDWIEPGGTPRWKEPERHADERRKNDGTEHDRGIEDVRNIKNGYGRQRQSQPQRDPHQPAYHRQCQQLGALLDGRWVARNISRGRR